VKDFSFLVGEWTVTNSRLKDSLDAESGWEEFPATASVTLALDGNCCIEEIAFPTKGFVGLAISLLDLNEEQWYSYWVNSNAGRLTEPVRGSFSGGQGDFAGTDIIGGQNVLVRSTWSDATFSTVRWEQAFSTDEGETWLTNWRMEFTRTES
jgi:hypothetical protein